MFRFSEWLKIESFMDFVEWKDSAKSAAIETMIFILETAEKSLFSEASGEIISGGPLDGCGEEIKEMPVSEAAKRMRSALMIIRAYGIKRRKRLVDAMQAIHGWMGRFDRAQQKDEDIDDLDFSEFSDVIPPKKTYKKDTYQVAVHVLFELQYITEGQADKILVGLNLPEGKESNKAHQMLRQKINEAAAEQGNEVRGNYTLDDFRKAQEELRCVALKLYHYNLQVKTAANKARLGNSKTGYRDFDDNDLFDEFFTNVINTTMKRKWDRGLLLPWGMSRLKRGSGKNLGFEELLNTSSDPEHLVNYLGSMINTTASQIRKKGSATNNPATQGEIESNIHKNGTRKSKIIKDDIEAYKKWKGKKENAARSESELLNDPDNPLAFYISYLKKSAPPKPNSDPDLSPDIVDPSPSSEPDERDGDKSMEERFREIKAAVEGKDRLRLEIMYAIEYEHTSKHLAKEILSMSPSDIVKTLEGYRDSFLKAKERQSIMASQLVVKGEEESSDETLSRIVRPKDSVGTNDDAYSGGVRGGPPSIFVNFFRPYILRAIKEIAARGEKATIRALLLCFKFQVPCSFDANSKGEPINLVVKEAEIVDSELDEKIKSYMFERMASGAGEHAILGDLSKKQKGGWSLWSHEGRTNRRGVPTRVIDQNSFCRIFFDTLFGGKFDNLERMSLVLSEIPETSRIVSASGKSVEIKHYEFDPRMFSSSWITTGKKNSLKSQKKTVIGDIFNGDKNLRGALSELCDKVFHDMIVQDGLEGEESVSLKDLIMARKKEQEEKAKSFALTKSTLDAKTKAARDAAARQASMRSPTRPLSATSSRLTSSLSPISPDDENDPSDL